MGKLFCRFKLGFVELKCRVLLPDVGRLWIGCHGEHERVCFLRIVVLFLHNTSIPRGNPPGRRIESALPMDGHLQTTRHWSANKMYCVRKDTIRNPHTLSCSL